MEKKGYATLDPLLQIFGNGYPAPEVPMVKKESLFLTREEALEAICRDFRQYDPQIILFFQIIRLISE